MFFSAAPVCAEANHHHQNRLYIIYLKWLPDVILIQLVILKVNRNIPRAETTSGNIPQITLRDLQLYMGQIPQDGENACFMSFFYFF